MGDVGTLCLSRKLNDWEVDSIELFLLSCKVRRDEEDKLLWTGIKNGKFFIKALYKDLESGRHFAFLASAIWNSLVSPMVSFFAWEATWNKVLTLDSI